MGMDSIDIGTLAGRPAPRTSTDGKFYLARDTNELFIQDDGTWKLVATAGAAPGVSQAQVDASIAAAIAAIPVVPDGAVLVSGMYDSAVHGAGIGFHNARAIGDPGGAAIFAPEGFFPIATVFVVTTPFDSATDAAIIALGYLEAGDALANPQFTVAQLDGSPSIIRRDGATEGEPAGVNSNLRVNIAFEALTAGAFEFYSIGVITE